ncbi:Chromate resistance protein ChrB [Pseudonocardia halophobica]|uniref:Chromate resistance protein ChrB n=1 Tax=Pseudonocardia halophobica TaxID=29401 RepID=UPI003D8E7A29
MVEATSSWVLLWYRVPREPSTPRIAVWRALKRLGVAQVGDGLVALPADARTREQLEWVAEDIGQACGESMLWTATPDSVADERRLATQMATARAAEYEAVTRRAGEAHDEGDRQGLVKRLRAELRRIERRDFFPPPERALARNAVDELAHRADAAQAKNAAGTATEGTR